MASKGRNMYLSSITIKYTLIDIVVSDYIPFPIFTHTHTHTQRGWNTSNTPQAFHAFEKKKLDTVGLCDIFDRFVTNVEINRMCIEATVAY